MSARARGVLLAALIAASTLSAHAWLRGDNPLGFTYTSLPGFDAYVYVAAAEHPSFFTAAPWGYRVLTPWLAHALPGVKTFKAFRTLSQATLLGLGVIFFVFLRRLGFTQGAAWLGVGLLCASPPVGELLANPFLVEPQAALLFLLILVALQAGAPLAMLGALFALMALAKDPVFALILLPVVYQTRRASVSRRRTVVDMAALGLGSFALAWGLRFYWTPHLLETPSPEGGLWSAAMSELARFGGKALLDALLYGLLPLAVLGLVRTRPVAYLRSYGYLIPILLALPFVAWLNKPAEQASGVYDGPRLWIYAVFLLIPLVLGLVQRPAEGLSAPTGRFRWLDRISVVALIAAVVLPFVVVDRYRRAPLHGRRDGVQVLAASRYSLRAAARLGRGDEVRLEPLPQAQPDDPARWRWYLLEGWTSLAYTGEAPIALPVRKGSFIIPLLEPREMEVEITWHISRPDVVYPGINGHPLLGVALDTRPRTHRFTLAPEHLFRGDNVFTVKIRRPCDAIWIDALVLR